MLKVAELRVRLAPSATGLHARSYRSMQNFARRSKRLVLSLVTHVLWNEKNTGAIKHESAPNTPSGRSFFSAILHPRTGAHRSTYAHCASFAARLYKIHRPFDIYASAVKKNNPIKANMPLGSHAAAQGGSAPLWPREMQNAERTQ